MIARILVSFSSLAVPLYILITIQRITMVQLFRRRAIQFSFFLSILSLYHCSAMERVEQTASESTPLTPPRRFYERDTSLRLLKEKKFLPDTGVMAAIETTEVSQFVKEMRVELSHFKEHVKEVIRVHGQLIGLHIVNFQNVDAFESYDELVEFLLWAFSSHSFESINRMEQGLTPINYLYEPLTRDPDIRKRVADRLRQICENHKGVLEEYKKHAAYKSRLWFTIQYAHIYGLPILIALSLIGLAIKPALEKNISVLISELMYLAIPFYVFSLAYVGLFVLKYGMTGSCCIAFNNDALEISDMLETIDTTLEKLRVGLISAEKKTFQVTLTPKKESRGKAMENEPKAITIEPID